MRHSPDLQTGLIYPAVEEREELLERILASDAFRNASVPRTIIRLLFKASLDGGGQPFSPATLAGALGFEHMDDPDAAARVAVSRVKKRLNRFYRDSAIPAGRWEEIVVSVDERKYSLSFRRNVGARADFNRHLHAATHPENLLAVLVASPLDWFNGELIAGFEKGARHFGYRVLFSTSEDDPDVEADQAIALSKQAAGIAVVPVSTKDDLGVFKKLKQKRRRFVFADRSIRGFSSVPRICSDGASGGFEATKYLLQERKCRRVFVLSERSVMTIEDRVEGWRRAFRAAGLIPEPKWEYQTDLRDEIAGYELMRELAESTSLTEGDGVFATSDVVGFGASAFIARAKWTFEIPIVGFDGRPAGACLNPPIASVHQDFGRIGEIAAEVLARIIRREPVESLYTVPVSLRKRNDNPFSDG